ncbi:MAG TPA: glycogen/starch synthase [Polyangiaceae bacterium]
MEVLMVSAELAPYARASEAADAVLGLSKALRQLGHDVTVVMPSYAGFQASGLLLARRLTPLVLPGGGEVSLLDGRLPSGVRLVLLDAPVLFDRSGVYEGAEHEEYPDNAKRFGLLSRASAALVRQRSQQDRAFDIVHLHDWPAALVPISLRTEPGPSVPNVLTIHDVTRQGVFHLRDLDDLGVPSESLAEDLRLGQKLNLLKGGVLYADALTTVSANYAAELLTEQRSGPLANVLLGLNRPVIPIHNGIDYSIWNPATDPALISRYDAEDIANKGRSKSELLRRMKLELEPSRPLVAVIDELSREPGLELLAGAMPGIAKCDLALVVATNSPDPVHQRLEALLEGARDRCALVGAPEESFLHLVYAAADFILVPSRHEPCGLPAMIAQRYGALPIAPATGGLSDSIVDCDAAFETGTGFLFDGHTQRALLGALQRGLAAYRSPAWPRLMRRVMRLDLSWDRPARRYLQVYRHALAV